MPFSCGVATVAPHGPLVGPSLRFIAYSGVSRAPPPDLAAATRMDVPLPTRRLPGPRSVRGYQRRQRLCQAEPRKRPRNRMERSGVVSRRCEARVPLGTAARSGLPLHAPRLGTRLARSHALAHGGAPRDRPVLAYDIASRAPATGAAQTVRSTRRSGRSARRRCGGGGAPRGPLRRPRRRSSRAPPRRPPGAARRGSVRPA